MITHIHNYTTQDGHEFRVEIIAFSQRRINSSKKHELRRVIHNLLSEKIPQWDLSSFIKQVTDENSDFNREILEKGKRISSLRHIGIKKTKLVSSPKSPIERSTIETETETGTETESETGTETENTEINKEPVEDKAKAA